MSLDGRGVEVFVVVNVFDVVVIVVGWLDVGLENLVACAVSTVVWDGLRSCFGLCRFFSWLFGFLFWLCGLWFVVHDLPCCGGGGYAGCAFAAAAVVRFDFCLRFCCFLVLRGAVVVSW